ncbi:MAG: hypothetical protein KDK75_19355, partial [Alphaproteobacteria bacterium]|nr:hypothetical protein [Alphaproteobacteria bacterium]
MRNAPRRNRLGEAITHQPIDERATYLTFDGSIKSQVALKMFPLQMITAASRAAVGFGGLGLVRALSSGR